MKLNHLSDQSLHSHLIQLAQKERELLAQILWHLREVDRRKLYCDYKCGSLYEYCLRVLKYSEGQASRRVNASRLLKEVPEIIEKIEAGTLNLTQINQVNQFFNDEEIQGPVKKKKIIELIEGKTTRESEKILWERKEKKAPRKVQVKLNEETVIKIKEVQALRAHKYKDLDSVLMEMSREVMNLWNPIVVSRKINKSNEDSRYLPVRVKSSVWERDKGKCQNCGSTYALELDHIKPFASGGKTNIENLRLLCRNCNQRQGHIQFGEYRRKST